jgi:hypothetical protein
VATVAPSPDPAQSSGPQNPNCILPDRPSDDFTLAGANTRFVQNAFSAVTGDCTFALGVIICTKTNGVAFAASATTDMANASNISSGTLNAARLPSPFTNGT